MAVDAALIAAVRGLIWDPPRAVQAERLGIGDGRRVAFQLECTPAIAGSLTVWVGVVDVTATATFDLALGLVTLEEAPETGEVIEADYAHALLSDAAIESQLEAHALSPLLAAARCLEVLLLDPVAIAALRIDGASLQAGDRRQAVEAAVGRYRQAGAYARFQARIDEPDWGVV